MFGIHPYAKLRYSEGFLPIEVKIAALIAGLAFFKEMVSEILELDITYLNRILEAASQTQCFAKEDLVNFVFCDLNRGAFFLTSVAGQWAFKAVLIAVTFSLSHTGVMSIYLLGEKIRSRKRD